MHSFRSQHKPESREDDIRLVLPGMRSKMFGTQPTLERLESCVSSPCVSDTTLTSRRLRELIPCTPSPMYAYESKVGFAHFENSGRMYPRFFPFPLYHPEEPASQCESFQRSKVESQISPNRSEASTRRHSSSPSDVLSPAPPPIAESVSEISTNDLLEELKKFVLPNGGFDIPASEASLSPDLVMNHVVDLSRDQLGSRYIQQLLDMDVFSESALDAFFQNILPEAKELTMDQFGNYVVQKLIDKLSHSATCRQSILDQLSGDFLNLSMHMYGCRVIQKLIEMGTQDQQLRIAQELQGHVIECVEDQNGNHVVQKLIEQLPSENLRFVVEEFSGNICVLAVHCYGCRVLQRLLEKLTQDDASVLVVEILSHLWHLAQDQYGNYVIQHVLIHGTAHNRSVIVQVIASHIVEFSCHKYASNIAEKALGSAPDQAGRDILIGAVIGSGNADCPLYVLMKDRFANYVIQRCIELSRGHQRQILVSILQQNISTLRRVIYGKHIATAIERIIATEQNFRVSE